MIAAQFWLPNSCPPPAAGCMMRHVGHPCWFATLMPWLPLPLATLQHASHLSRYMLLTCLLPAVPGRGKADH